MKSSALQTRKCNICRKEKKISEFGMKLDKTGKRKSCEHCYQTQRNGAKKAYKERKFMSRNEMITDDIDVSQPLKLNFLLDLNGWTKEEIKLFLLTVQKYSAAPYRMFCKDIYKKYFPFRSSIVCSQVLKEFKLVAEAGIEFDRYMEGERKFRRDGKKIIAKAPK